MDTAQYQNRFARSAERVAEDVWLLSGRPRHAINVYLFGDVLLDAGTRHAAGRILRSTADVRLSAHVLTHAHMDHMGASHAVCDRLELPYLCGAGDVAAAESGGRRELSSRGLRARLQHRIMAGPRHRVAATLGEGDEVAGFTVLEVPGHSPGHLALWRERDRLLICGDVLFNLRLPSLRAGLGLPPQALTPDPVQNLHSARKLADLRPATVCFGHGPVLRDGDRFGAFVHSAAAGAAGPRAPQPPM